MKVSIITVCKNAEGTIEKTIQSVIKQSYSDIEYIIIDGKSEDKTIEIVEKYKDKIRLFISEEDAGIYDAMNKGIKAATGDWIYFLGADDVIYSGDTISKIFSDKKMNDYDVIYGNIITKNKNKIYDGKFNKNKIIIKNICHQSIFYNRDIFKKIGLYNLRYKALADYDFNIRCFGNKDIKFLYINEIIAVYNERGFNFSYKDRPFKKDFKINIISNLGISYYFKYIIYKVIKFILYPVKYILKRIKNNIKN